VVTVRRGLTITVAMLDAAGLLAAQLIRAATTSSVSSHASRRVFPDYERCLASKNGNRSDADAKYLWIAIERGFTFAEAWDELNRVAWRPKLKRESYRRRTRDYVSSWRLKIPA
jgi:hypothetical protein